MKTLIAIGTIICACILNVEEGVAAMSCVVDNNGRVINCIDVTPKRPISPFNPSPQAPIHNPSECTLATGCMSWR